MGRSRQGISEDAYNLRKQGLSPSQIAEKLSKKYGRTIRSGNISNHIKCHEQSLKSGTVARKGAPIHEEVAKLHKTGMSAREIAMELGVPINTVYNAQSQHGLKSNIAPKSPALEKAGSEKIFAVTKQDEIVRLHATGMTSIEIAQKLDCSLQHVYVTLSAKGLRSNVSGGNCRGIPGGKFYDGEKEVISDSSKKFFRAVPKMSKIQETDIDEFTLEHNPELEASIKAKFMCNGGPGIDATDLLVLHGLDPAEWSCRCAWHKETPNRKCYSSILACPKKSSEKTIDLEKTIKECAATITAVKDKKLPAPKEEDPIWIIAIADLHLGMSEWKGNYSVIDDTADNIKRALADADELHRVPKKIVITILGDVFHSDTNYKAARTHKNTSLGPWNPEEAFEVYTDFIDSILLDCSEVCNDVEVWITPGNHDQDKLISACAGLKLLFEERYERVKFNCLKYEEQFKVLILGDRAVLISHDPYKNASARNQFDKLRLANRKAYNAVDYQIALSGHVHHQTSVAQNGVIQYGIGTKSPASFWENNCGYNAATHCWTIFEFVEGKPEMKLTEI